MASKKNMESMISGIMGTKEKALAAKRSQDVQDITAKVRKPGRPKIRTEASAPSEVGCKPGEVRTTTILDKELMERVRRLAYWDRRSIKTVMGMAIEQYVDAYEKKNGKLQPIPEQ